MWNKLLLWLGLREQARISGASASDANKTGAIGVLLNEVQKKAEEEAKAEAAKKTS